MYLLKIEDALKAGDTGEIRRLISEALEKGFSANDILNKSLLPAMNEVDRMFIGSKLFIPEVLKVSRSMHAAIRLLQSRVPDAKDLGRAPVKVVIGTVAGDLHDIGKNLVTIFMKARGYNVINLGIDVPKEDFVWAVRKHKPQVLAMSALLTTTMYSMQDTISELKKAGIRENVKILVGGGPVTKQFAEEIGADGYATDAIATIEWLNNQEWSIDLNS